MTVRKIKQGRKTMSLPRGLTYSVISYGFTYEIKRQHTFINNFILATS